MQQNIGSDYADDEQIDALFKEGFFDLTEEEQRKQEEEKTTRKEEEEELQNLYRFLVNQSENIAKNICELKDMMESTQSPTAKKFLIMEISEIENKNDELGNRIEVVIQSIRVCN